MKKSLSQIINTKIPSTICAKHPNLAKRLTQKSAKPLAIAKLTNAIHKTTSKLIVLCQCC